MITANPLSDQLWIILTALLGGAGCAAVYDVLTEIRLAVGRRGVELILDALFSVFVAGVVFFFVAGIAQTRLRGFMPLSMLAGSLLWRVTIGRLFRWLLQKCWIVLKTIAAVLYGFCMRLASFLHRFGKKADHSQPILEKSRKK